MAKKMYSCAGVSLDYKDGIYVITTINPSGENQTVEIKNPVHAVNYFSGQINHTLLQSLHSYLDKQGKNSHTGCDETEMTCYECKCSGNFLNKNCQLDSKERQINGL